MANIWCEVNANFHLNIRQRVTLNKVIQIWSDSLWFYHHLARLRKDWKCQILLTNWGKYKPHMYLILCNPYDSFVILCRLSTNNNTKKGLKTEKTIGKRTDVTLCRYKTRIHEPLEKGQVMEGRITKMTMVDYISWVYLPYQLIPVPTCLISCKWSYRACSVGIAPFHTHGSSLWHKEGGKVEEIGSWQSPNDNISWILGLPMA